MDLLPQNVGGPARTVGAGFRERYGYSHAVTLVRLSGMFRPGDAGLQRQLRVLRQLGFGFDQLKPGFGRLLRHPCCDAAFPIPVSRT